jgi:uncharacterized cupin superfamily protein
MSASFIETSHLDVELRSAPIERSWIIEGDPVARNALVSKSADGAATTIVWDCSRGKFNWYYDVDETIYILEGSIVLQSETMKPTRYSAGDVVFFKRGAHAKWEVDNYVRKLAFCRRTQPRIMVLGLKVASRLKRIVLSYLPGARQQSAAGAFFQ